MFQYYVTEVAVLFQYYVLTGGCVNLFQYYVLTGGCVNLFQYYVFSFLLVFPAYSVFLQISFLVKLGVMCLSFLIFNLAVHLGKNQVFEDYDNSIVLAAG